MFFWNARPALANCGNIEASGGAHAILQLKVTGELHTHYARLLLVLMDDNFSENPEPQHWRECVRRWNNGEKRSNSSSYSDGAWLRMTLKMGGIPKYLCICHHYCCITSQSPNDHELWGGLSVKVAFSPPPFSKQFRRPHVFCARGILHHFSRSKIILTVMVS